MDVPPPPQRSTASAGRRTLAVAAAVALGGIAVLGLRQDPEASRQAAWMAGIFALAATLWVTEALPLFATALLVIALEIVLLANPGRWPGLGFAGAAAVDTRQVLAWAADPVLLLFLGGFLLAQAAVKEGVDRAMSAWLLRPFGTQPRRVLLGVMLVTALFSMWMNNTATTAMMMTLVTPLMAGMPPGEPFRKALLLAVPFAANLGGMSTPIGSPPNAVALGYLQKTGHGIGFLQWMLVAVPFLLVLLLACWGLLWHWHRPGMHTWRIEFGRQRLTGRGRLVVGTFTLTVLLWLTDHWHGLPAAVVALLPVVLFTATRLLNRDDLNRVEWNVLILIAGGIALGAGMQATGLDQWLVRRLPAGGGAVGTLAVLVLATLGLSTFMSNTAAANLLLPVGVSLSITQPAAGLSPVVVALGIALSASAAMALPISTPPNAIAYGRGGLRTAEMARAGVMIGLLAAVMIVLLLGPLTRWLAVGR